MKPFVINRNTWHYKLNKHFFQEYEHNMSYNWEPRHNNFCSYWRATVFRVIAVCLFVIFIAGALYIAGSAVYYHPINTLIIVGTAIGFFAFLILTFIISEKLKSISSKRNPKPESLLVQRYRAHKSKICPMVEYSNDY
jgi:hypothetical protein